MSIKLKFSNEVLILKEEEQGLGKGRPPAGFARLEVRDEKGKITVAVQDLEDSCEYRNYEVYLIRYGGKEINLVLLGEIPVKIGRGKINGEFAPLNVGDTGFSIDDFNIVAIILNYTYDGKKEIRCPLAFYRGEKLRWMDPFKISKDAKIIPEKYDKEAIKRGKGRVFIENIEEKDKNISIEDKKEEDTNIGDTNIENVETKNLSNEDAGNENIDTGIDTDADADTSTDVGADTDSGTGTNVDTENVSEENYMERAAKEKTGADYRTALAEATEEDAKTVIEEAGEEIRKEAPREDFTEKDTGASPDMDALIGYFDRTFKRCDPFNIRRRDYKWWKIHNPAYLSDILQHCNIFVSKIFSPPIIMSYYKYRYLITGVYVNDKRDKKYIVYGIPGTYGIDESPLGSVCRWTQIEGGMPKYGAFGYWVAYIDPTTGQLLKLE